MKNRKLLKFALELRFYRIILSTILVLILGVSLTKLAFHMETSEIGKYTDQSFPYHLIKEFWIVFLIGFVWAVLLLFKRRSLNKEILKEE